MKSCEAKGNMDTCSDTMMLINTGGDGLQEAADDTVVRTETSHKKV